MSIQQLTVSAIVADLETMEWLLACESGRQRRTHVKTRVESGYFAVGCNILDIDNDAFGFRFSASLVAEIKSDNGELDADGVDDDDFIHSHACDMSDLNEPAWRVNRADLTHSRRRCSWLNACQW